MDFSIKGVESFDWKPLIGKSQPLHSPNVQPRAQPLLPCVHWQGRTFWVSIESFSFCIFKDQVCTFSAHYHKYLVDLCLSQTQPDWFLYKARAKWCWVQRTSLASCKVHFTPSDQSNPLIWRLVRALSNGILLNMFILVPIFYWRIFKFRKAQDLMKGIQLESVIDEYNIHIQEWRQTILNL